MPIHHTINWDYVLAAADEQGITPILADWVKNNSPAIPPSVTDGLHTAYWTNHFRNRVLLAELRRVLAAAAAASLPVMPLKGAALAMWYYRTPALRPMSDLDLLIHPCDTDRLARLLVAIGYAPIPKTASIVETPTDVLRYREHGFVARIDGIDVMIEIRDEALDPAVSPVLMANPAMAATYRQHGRTMWLRSENAIVGEIRCPRITPEDLLLHVASHLITRHAGLRLLWLHDLAVIADTHRDTLDWEYIGASARELHLSIPVASALAASAQWLGAPIPPREIAEMRHARGPGALWAVAERRLIDREVAALGTCNLAAAPPLAWRPLAITLGWLVAGLGPHWTFGRLVVPSRSYMAWWYTGDVTSTRAYARAVSFRITYIGLSVLSTLAARIRAYRLSRWTGRRARTMQTRTRSVL